jgi:hypothetical protein
MHVFMCTSRYVSLKGLFRDRHGRRANSLGDMLAQYRLPFEGQVHCGLDDARNIARLAVAMMRDGVEFACNDAITASLDHLNVQSSGNGVKKFAKKPFNSNINSRSNSIHNNSHSNVLISPVVFSTTSSPPETATSTAASSSSFSSINQSTNASKSTQSKRKKIPPVDNPRYDSLSPSASHLPSQLSITDPSRSKTTPSELSNTGAP